MGTKRCFHYLWEHSVSAIDEVQPYNNVAGTNLRNRQWMLQTRRPSTKINQYEKKDLHLQQRNKLSSHYYLGIHEQAYLVKL
jgi:hypothetical protein